MRNIRSTPEYTNFLQGFGAIHESAHAYSYLQQVPVANLSDLTWTWPTANVRYPVKSWLENVQLTDPAVQFCQSRTSQRLRVDLSATGKS